MVFSKYIASVLTTYLGSFIKDVDRDSVNVSLLRGSVELRNLEPHPSLLPSNVPVQLVRGLIGSLRLQIPWRKLYSQQCVIRISDVCVVLSSASPDEAQEVVQDLLANKLKLLELFKLSESIPRDEHIAAANGGTADAAEPQSKKNTTSGFFDRLRKSILNNIRFEIHDLTIRFESRAQTSQHGSMSIVLKIPLVTCEATDEKFQPAFVSQDSDVICRSLSYQNVVVQLNDTNSSARSSGSGTSESKNWVEMDGDTFVHACQNTPPQSFVNVLDPSHGRVCVSYPFPKQDVGHNGSTATNDTVVNIAVVVQPGTVHLRHETFLALLTVLKNILRARSTLQRTTILPKRVQRPPELPNKATAKRRWQYAIGETVKRVHECNQQTRFDWSRYLTWKAKCTKYYTQTLSELNAPWVAIPADRAEVYAGLENDDDLSLEDLIDCRKQARRAIDDFQRTGVITKYVPYLSILLEKMERDGSIPTRDGQTGEPGNTARKGTSISVKATVEWPCFMIRCDDDLAIIMTKFVVSASLTGTKLIARVGVHEVSLQYYGNPSLDSSGVTQTPSLTPTSVHLVRCSNENRPTDDAITVSCVGDFESSDPAAVEVNVYHISAYMDDTLASALLTKAVAYGDLAPLLSSLDEDGRHSVPTDQKSLKPHTAAFSAAKKSVEVLFSLQEVRVSLDESISLTILSVSGGKGATEAVSIFVEEASVTAAGAAVAEVRAARLMPDSDKAIDDAVVGMHIGCGTVSLFSNLDGIEIIKEKCRALKALVTNNVQRTTVPKHTPNESGGKASPTPANELTRLAVSAKVFEFDSVQFHDFCLAAALRDGWHLLLTCVGVSCGDAIACPDAEISISAWADGMLALSPYGDNIDHDGIAFEFEAWSFDLRVNELVTTCLERAYDTAALVVFGNEDPHVYLQDKDTYTRPHIRGHVILHDSSICLFDPINEPGGVALPGVTPVPPLVVSAGGSRALVVKLDRYSDKRMNIDVDLGQGLTGFLEGQDRRVELLPFREGGRLHIGVTMTPPRKEDLGLFPYSRLSIHIDMVGRALLIHVATVMALWNQFNTPRLPLCRLRNVGSRIHYSYREDRGRHLLPRSPTSEIHSGIGFDAFVQSQGGRPPAASPGGPYSLPVFPGDMRITFRATRCELYYPWCDGNPAMPHGYVPDFRLFMSNRDSSLRVELEGRMTFPTVRVSTLQTCSTRRPAPQAAAGPANLDKAAAARRCCCFDKPTMAVKMTYTNDSRPPFHTGVSDEMLQLSVTGCRGAQGRMFTPIFVDLGAREFAAWLAMIAHGRGGLPPAPPDAAPAASPRRFFMKLSVAPCLLQLHSLDLVVCLWDGFGFSMYPGGKSLDIPHLSLLYSAQFHQRAVFMTPAGLRARLAATASGAHAEGMTQANGRTCTGPIHALLDVPAYTTASDVQDVRSGKPTRTQRSGLVFVDEQREGAPSTQRDMEEGSTGAASYRREWVVGPAACCITEELLLEWRHASTIKAAKLSRLQKAIAACRAQLLQSYQDDQARFGARTFLHTPSPLPPPPPPDGATVTTTPPQEGPPSVCFRLHTLDLSFCWWSAWRHGRVALACTLEGVVYRGGEAVELGMRNASVFMRIGAAVTEGQRPSRSGSARDSSDSECQERGYAAPPGLSGPRWAYNVLLLTGLGVITEHVPRNPSTTNGTARTPHIHVSPACLAIYPACYVLLCEMPRRLQQLTEEQQEARRLMRRQCVADTTVGMGPTPQEGAPTTAPRVPLTTVLFDPCFGVAFAKGEPARPLVCAVTSNVRGARRRAAAVATQLAILFAVERGVGPPDAGTSLAPTAEGQVALPNASSTARTRGAACWVLQMPGLAIRFVDTPLEPPPDQSEQRNGASTHSRVRRGREQGTRPRHSEEGPRKQAGVRPSKRNGETDSQHSSSNTSSNSDSDGDSENSSTARRQGRSSFAGEQHGGAGNDDAMWRCLQRVSHATASALGSATPLDEDGNFCLTPSFLSTVGGGEHEDGEVSGHFPSQFHSRMRLSAAGPQRSALSGVDSSSTRSNTAAAAVTMTTSLRELLHARDKLSIRVSDLEVVSYGDAWALTCGEATCLHDQPLTTAMLAHLHFTNELSEGRHSRRGRGAPVGGPSPTHSATSFPAIQPTNSFVSSSNRATDGGSRAVEAGPLDLDEVPALLRLRQLHLWLPQSQNMPATEAGLQELYASLTRMITPDTGAQAAEREAPRVEEDEPLLSSAIPSLPVGERVGKETHEAAASNPQNEETKAEKDSHAQLALFGCHVEELSAEVTADVVLSLATFLVELPSQTLFPLYTRTPGTEAPSRGEETSPTASRGSTVNGPVITTITESTYELHEDLVLCRDKRILFFSSAETNHITVNLNGHTVSLDVLRAAAAARRARAALRRRGGAAATGPAGSRTATKLRPHAGIVLVVESGLSVTLTRGRVLLPLYAWSRTLLETAARHGIDHVLLPYMALGEGSYVQCEDVRLGFTADFPSTAVSVLGAQLVLRDEDSDTDASSVSRTSIPVPSSTSEDEGNPSAERPSRRSRNSRPADTEHELTVRSDSDNADDDDDDAYGDEDDDDGDDDGDEGSGMFSSAMPLLSASFISPTAVAAFAAAVGTSRSHPGGGTLPLLTVQRARRGRRHHGGLRTTEQLSRPSQRQHEEERGSGREMAVESGDKVAAAAAASPHVCSALLYPSSPGTPPSSLGSTLVSSELSSRTVLTMPSSTNSGDVPPPPLPPLMNCNDVSASPEAAGNEFRNDAVFHDTPLSLALPQERVSSPLGRAAPTPVTPGTAALPASPTSKSAPSTAAPHFAFERHVQVVVGSVTLCLRAEGEPRLLLLESGFEARLRFETPATRTASSPLGAQPSTTQLQSDPALPPESRLLRSDVTLRGASLHTQLVGATSTTANTTILSPTHLELCSTHGGRHHALAVGALMVDLTRVDITTLRGLAEDWEGMSGHLSYMTSPQAERELLQLMDATLAWRAVGARAASDVASAHHMMQIDGDAEGRRDEASHRGQETAGGKEAEGEKEAEDAAALEASRPAASEAQQPSSTAWMPQEEAPPASPTGPASPAGSPKEEAGGTMGPEDDTTASSIVVHFPSFDVTLSDHRYPLVRLRTADVVLRHERSLSATLQAVYAQVHAMQLEVYGKGRWDTVVPPTLMLTLSRTQLLSRHSGNDHVAISCDGLQVQLSYLVVAKVMYASQLLQRLFAPNTEDAGVVVEAEGVVARGAGGTGGAASSQGEHSSRKQGRRKTVEDDVQDGTASKSLTGPLQADDDHDKDDSGPAAKERYMNEEESEDEATEEGAVVGAATGTSARMPLGYQVVENTATHRFVNDFNVTFFLLIGPERDADRLGDWFCLPPATSVDVLIPYKRASDLFVYVYPSDCVEAVTSPPETMAASRTTFSSTKRSSRMSAGDTRSQSRRRSADDDGDGDEAAFPLGSLPEKENSVPLTRRGYQPYALNDKGRRLDLSHTRTRVSELQYGKAAGVVVSSTLLVLSCTDHHGMEGQVGGPSVARSGAGKAVRVQGGGSDVFTTARGETADITYVASRWLDKQVDTLKSAGDSSGREEEEGDEEGGPTSRHHAFGASNGVGEGGRATGRASRNLALSLATTTASAADAGLVVVRIHAKVTLRNECGVTLRVRQRLIDDDVEEVAESASSSPVPDEGADSRNREREKSEEPFGASAANTDVDRNDSADDDDDDDDDMRTDRSPHRARSLVLPSGYHCPLQGSCSDVVMFCRHGSRTYSAEIGVLAGESGTFVHLYPLSEQGNMNGGGGDVSTSTASPPLTRTNTTSGRTDSERFDVVVENDDEATDTHRHGSSRDPDNDVDWRTREAVVRPGRRLHRQDGTPPEGRDRERSLADGPALMRSESSATDGRPLTVFVVFTHSPESLSTVITIYPRVSVVNHTGVPVKVTLWQSDPRAGPQTVADATTLRRWLPWSTSPGRQGQRDSSRGPTQEKLAYYRGLVPLAAHDDLHHKHALPVLQCTYDGGLSMALSLTQSAGDTIHTEDVTEVVSHLRDAVDHHPRLLTLRDNSGRTFYVQVNVLARTVILSVGMWVCNLTEYPLLLSDSIVTRRLCAGQSASTGIIPSQGTPFLIGCKLQDFTQAFFKVGLDGTWSGSVPIEVGSSGVFESTQAALGITRSCNYAIQLPNAQEGRPMVILVTPRWIILNNTTKRLQLFIDFPGLTRILDKAKARLKEKRKEALEAALIASGLLGTKKGRATDVTVLTAERAEDGTLTSLSSSGSDPPLPVAESEVVAAAAAAAANALSSPLHTGPLSATHPAATASPTSLPRTVQLATGTAGAPDPASTTAIPEEILAAVERDAEVVAAATTVASLRSVARVHLKPGEYHVSCVGAAEGNRLALQENLEGTVPSVTSITHRHVQHKDLSVYYESQPTEYLSVDTPTQATFNLWAAPRAAGKQMAINYGATLLAYRSHHLDPTGLEAFDPYEQEAVVTGRLVVSVQSADNVLAVVLQGVRATKILIQNRTRSSTVMVRQQGSRRRNVVPARQNRYFLWEDSRRAHTIRVHVEGYKGAWFEVDFSHGDCRVTRGGALYETPEATTKTAFAPSPDGRKGGGAGAGSGEGARRGRDRSSAAGRAAARVPEQLPFSVHGYTSADKTRVTVLVTEREVPSYATVEAWRTSRAVSLNLSYVKAWWLVEMARVGSDLVARAREQQQQQRRRPGTVASSVPPRRRPARNESGRSLSSSPSRTRHAHHGHHHHHYHHGEQQMSVVVAKFFSIAMEGVDVDVLETEDNMSVFVAIHQVQLIDEVNASVFAYRARLLLPAAPAVSVPPPPAPPASAAEPPLPVRLRQPGELLHLSQGVWRTTTTTAQTTPRFGARRTRATPSVFSSHPSLSTSAATAAVTMEGQTLRAGLTPSSTARAAPPAVAMRLPPTSDAVAIQVLGGRRAALDRFLSRFFPRGRWREKAEALELPNDIELSYSMIKYPDGMSRVTELSGSVTALVLVLSDTWLATALNEARRMMSLRATMPAARATRTPLQQREQQRLLLRLQRQEQLAQQQQQQAALLQETRSSRRKVSGEGYRSDSSGGHHSLTTTPTAATTRVPPSVFPRRGTLQPNSPLLPHSDQRGGTSGRTSRTASSLCDGVDLDRPFPGRTAQTHASPTVSITASAVSSTSLTVEPLPAPSGAAGHVSNAATSSTGMGARPTPPPPAPPMVDVFPRQAIFVVNVVDGLRERHRAVELAGSVVAAPIGLGGRGLADDAATMGNAEGVGSLIGGRGNGGGGASGGGGAADTASSLTTRATTTTSTAASRGSQHRARGKDRRGAAKHAHHRNGKSSNAGATTAAAAAAPGFVPQPFLFIERMRIARVSLFITFQRHRPDPLRPLLGAYTLMLPSQLEQREFYLRPFTLAERVETVGSLQARMKRWCLHGLREQWAKATKIGSVLDTLRWWRTTLPLRGPPIRLTLAVVERRRSELLAGVDKKAKKAKREKRRHRRDNGDVGNAAAEATALHPSNLSQQHGQQQQQGGGMTHDAVMGFLSSSSSSNTTPSSSASSSPASSRSASLSSATSVVVVASLPAPPNV